MKNILQQASSCVEKISIFTFGNNECESEKEFAKRFLEKFEVKSLCTPFICLPIQKQSSNFAKENFDYLKE